MIGIRAPGPEGPWTSMTDKSVLLLEQGAQGQFMVKDTSVLNAGGLEPNCEKGPEMVGFVSLILNVPSCFIAVSQSQCLGIV